MVYVGFVVATEIESSHIQCQPNEDGCCRVNEKLPQVLMIMCVCVLLSERIDCSCLNSVDRTTWHKPELCTALCVCV